jgi:hypothetical protein
MQLVPVTYFADIMLGQCMLCEIYLVDIVYEVNLKQWSLRNVPGIMNQLLHTTERDSSLLWENKFLLPFCIIWRTEGWCCYHICVSGSLCKLAASSIPLFKQLPQFLGSEDEHNDCWGYSAVSSYFLRVIRMKSTKQIRRAQVMTVRPFTCFIPVRAKLI